MIPLKDLNPRRTFPVITLGLIAVNFLVFFHQLQLDPSALNRFIDAYALVPARLQLALTSPRMSLQDALTPVFTSMFLHGGWLHIIGNMWFLWIFGDNVEDELGHVPYLLFYLVCGVGASLTQVFFTLGSRVPSLGASGAISGVLGAYLLFFPRSQILTLVPLFVFWFTARLPALVFIGLWFAVQFLSGVGSLGGSVGSGGIAWWAHVGGFVLGMLLALTMRRSPPPPRYSYE
jgi:membrane associated rhomboid family serine protease